MLPKGQERVGDRIDSMRRGKEGVGHEQSHQQSPFYRSVTARHFSSVARRTGCCCCSSLQGEGGLVMAHGGRTAVNITGFLQRGSMPQSWWGSRIQVLIWLWLRARTVDVAFLRINHWALKKPKKTSSNQKDIHHWSYPTLLAFARGTPLLQCQLGV